ncbi:MAG TPA: alginate lyase family protein, partial [Acidimicrobiia bacterium]|nr:alginate lyase family protein [Acidimicrobiia bacterium]
MPMRPRHLRLLGRSIRHTRPAQLWFRLVRVIRSRLPFPVRHRDPEVEATGAFTLPLVTRPEWVDADVVSVAGQHVRVADPLPWSGDGLDAGTGLAHLTLHYMTYLHDVDLYTFHRIVDDWIERHPGTDADRGGFAWNPYAIAIRAMVWMHELTRRAGELTEGFRPRADRSLARQLAFLARRLERDVGGNHLIKDLAALMAGSCYFEGPAADTWATIAESRLLRQLDEQVLADGMHFERSFSYHAAVVSDLLVCHRATESPVLRRRLEDVLASMAQVLADGTHPDGAAALFNDAGLRAGPDPEQLLTAVADALGSDPPSPRGRFDLPVAGYFGWRRSDDLVIVDCGPIGPDHLPAHAHGDVLSFEWTVDGRRLIVDAGVSQYGYGEDRRYSRATSSHNTVTVDRADQAEFWSAFRVGRRPNVTLESLEDRGDDGFRLVGSHDGFSSQRGRPRHRRRFDVSADGILVDDEVSGGAGQPVEARLLLHPEVQFTPDRVGGFLRVGSTEVRLEADGPVSVVEAWWCPDFGVKLPTSQIVIAYGGAPSRGGFRLIRRS